MKLIETGTGQKLLPSTNIGLRTTFTNRDRSLGIVMEVQIISLLVVNNTSIDLLQVIQTHDHHLASISIVTELKKVVLTMENLHTDLQ